MALSAGSLGYKCAVISIENQAVAAPGPVAFNSIWPWFMGVPWAPRFNGKSDGLKYGDWANQMKALLRAQRLTEEQTIDFILSAVEDDAKREIQLLDEQNRNTADKIFDFLNRLYGGTSSAADLRMKCFNIRQGSREVLSDFSLHILEAFQQWREAEPDGTARQETTLRDQLIVSLQAGLLKKELQRQVRRTPYMTCSELFEEAKELEKECWGDDCERQSKQVMTVPQSDDSTQWEDQSRTGKAGHRAGKFEGGTEEQ